MTAPTSPNSADFLTSSRASAQSCFSSSGMRGRTSLSMNSRVVSAIMRCSSVKSSGAKTSSGVRSSIKKAPPLIICFSSATADIKNSFLLFNSLDAVQKLLVLALVHLEHLWGGEGQDEEGLLGLQDVNLPQNVLAVNLARASGGEGAHAVVRGLVARRSHLPVLDGVVQTLAQVVNGLVEVAVRNLNDHTDGTHRRVSDD